MATNAATISTNEIYVGESASVVLTDYLESLESDVSNKAASNHSHTDLENAIEGLEDGKAEAVHTHEMSAINGLNAALTELEEEIAAIQNSGGSAAVTPMLVATMRLGKLDNNSGAENSSSTRICSEPFAVEPGKSYWQINDKGVNMYVLIYDADELFLGYLGSFASGAEIAVTNENAAYMRLGSLLGEYDLNNEFRIYDVDPESGESSGGGAAVDAYSKDESDERYAPAAHTHDGYAAADHAHSGYAVTDHAHDGYAASSHTHTAADITGLPSSVDAYSRTESDNRFAPVSHTHDGYAAATHTHSGYAAEGHTHSGYAASTHSHTEYAASGHTHTAAAVGAAASNHTHTPASIGAAASSHTHDYAASNHTHSGYAASSHTHSGYASSSHDHDDDYAAKSHTHHPANIGALSSSGGTISGALTVMLDSIFNGVLNTQKIQPKDSGSYSIGTDSNRFYSTYLRVNPNVSSDRRRKRDIAALNVDTLAEFVNNLSVVAYNYNDDAEDEAKRIGLVAQDVIDVDPGIAAFFVEQSEEGYYSLRPADFVFPLIAAVQQLSARVAVLEGK